MFLVKKMPRPYAAASGLEMNVFRPGFRLFLDDTNWSLNCLLNSPNSAGKSHVWGKNL